MNYIYLSGIFIVLLPVAVGAQVNVNSIEPGEDFENIKVHKLYSDSLASSFIVWAKTGVKPHLHQYHSESVYVLEGEGKMWVGRDQIDLIKGVFVYIPKNTVHSVKVTSETPIKVISIQAPEFLGEDRVFVEND